MMRKYYYIILLSIMGTLSAEAQETIKGAVYDHTTRKPIKGAVVINTHTSLGMQTDSAGNFNVKVNADDLVEISMEGYKTSRVRIPKGELPTFFKVNLKLDVTELAPVTIVDKEYNHKRDSIKTAEVYRRALELYQLDGLDMIQHPFDALSKRNRQIWAFQKHYQYWETEKYIDYVFNDKLIMQLTNMDSSSVNMYKERYRPNQQSIYSFASDYEFYEYIKYTGKLFMDQNVRPLKRDKNEFKIDYNDR